MAAFYQGRNTVSEMLINLSKVTELISVRIEIETLICLLPKLRLLTVTLFSISYFMKLIR